MDIRTITLLAPLAALLAGAAGAGEAPGAGAPASGHVKSKDGTKIAFARGGKGPALLLVGGALSAGGDSAGLAALLERRFTVFRYDRRGRGGSGDRQPYAVEREVEDIEALLDLAGGKASLFGSSSGAVLALEAAARLTGKVQKLALFEPPFIVDDSRPPVPVGWTAKVKRLAAEGKRGEAVASFMIDAVGLPAEFLPGMRRMPIWPSMEALAHTLAYDAAIMEGTQSGKPLPSKRWASLKAPAIVLHGGASDLWLARAAEALTKLLPGARREELAGLDHAAPHMAPGALAPAIERFLAE